MAKVGASGRGWRSHAHQKNDKHHDPDREAESVLVQRCIVLHSVEIHRVEAPQVQIPRHIDDHASQEQPYLVDEGITAAMSPKSPKFHR